MSANMFAALSDDPTALSKPVAAAAPVQKAPAQKSVVGGAKKSDAPKASASSPQQVTKGRLPGEVRKDSNRGPRKTHQPHKDQEGRIRGREFDRHSATGRPAHSNEQRRGGAGRFNAGSLKDARADEEAATVAATAEVAVDGAEVTTAAIEEVVAQAETSAEVVEPEPKTQSIAAYRAEQAKKQKEFEASLGTSAGETRTVKHDWYKPETKTAAAPAASSSSSKASAAPKQAKNFVPLSQVIGEKPQFRSEDRRGARPERSGDRPERTERTERTERSGERTERSGERTERTFNKGGNRQQQQQGGNRGPRKQKETFDATAASDRDFPALGH